MRPAIRVPATLLFCIAGGSCGWGTRVASTQPISFHGESAYRVVCNYDFSNCVDQAERKCRGPFEELNAGNRSSSYPAGGRGQTAPNDPTVLRRSAVYRGVLEFRCKQHARART